MVLNPTCEPEKSPVSVKFKRLTANAVVPTKAHPTDAGYDITATSAYIDKCGNAVYGTGLALEIPEGYAGFLFPRSSVCATDIALTNAVGVVDSHYRGEVKFKFRPTPMFTNVPRTAPEDSLYTGVLPFSPKIYQPGERIGQLIVLPVPDVTFIECDSLSDTDRGEGGYGSSGK